MVNVKIFIVSCQHSFRKDNSACVGGFHRCWHLHSKWCIWMIETMKINKNMIDTCMIDTCMIDTCMIDICMIDTCMIDTCVIDTCMIDMWLTYNWHTIDIWLTCGWHMYDWHMFVCLHVYVLAYVLFHSSDYDSVKNPALASVEACKFNTYFHFIVTTIGFCTYIYS